MLILYVIALAMGFFLLVKGANYFVEGASDLATNFGISQLAIGLTIVAMGTSIPEAAVSLTAAFRGNADITVGNIVGSNILNVLIILGVASVIVPIAVRKSTIKYEIPFMTLCPVILLLLGKDGKIDFKDGVILLIAFFIYLAYLFIGASSGMKSIGENVPINVGLTVAYIVGGLVAVIIGSDFVVAGATKIARMFNVSERFIGLTIVAFGTSLPELFTSVIAATKGNADIAMGNIVGSNIFNILFVIGTSGLITIVPFKSDFLFDTGMVMVTSILLLLCVIPKQTLTRQGGLVLLTCYAVYFAYLCI